MCIKERNRLETEALERRRLEAGHGDNEAQERDKEVIICFIIHLSPCVTLVNSAAGQENNGCH